MRRDVIYGRYVLVLCAWVVGACAAGAPASRRSAMAPGRAAPGFTAKGLDDVVFQLDSLRGQVIVLNLWAAWCEGCEKDLPLLDEMAIRLDGHVRVVAVSLDSSRDRLDPLVNSRAWRLTMLHEPTGRVGELYQPASMPAVYLIDRSGTVRGTYLGLRTDQLRAIEGEARALSLRK